MLITQVFAHEHIVDTIIIVFQYVINNEIWTKTCFAQKNIVILIKSTFVHVN